MYLQSGVSTGISQLFLSDLFSVCCAKIMYWVQVQVRVHKLTLEMFLMKAVFRAVIPYLSAKISMAFRKASSWGPDDGAGVVMT